MDIIVAITGSTGVIYGIRLLEILKETEHNTHLIISFWGEKNIEIETNYTVSQVKSLASYNYSYSNLGAAISSGSHPNDSMVIVPCSMKTLSSIAHGYSENLISRAADVTLKERKKLVIVPRETPLTTIHLENMLTITRAGGVILPPMPAFYYMPKTIDDIINHTVGKVLDQLKVSNSLFRRWEGLA